MKLVRVLMLAAGTLFFAISPLGMKTAVAAPQAQAAKAGGPSDREIADAKTKGMVWVNSESKIYHKDGQFYGKTKQGQFMTEADAQKAGNRAAKNEIGEKGSKTAKTAPPAAKAQPIPTAAPTPAPVASAPAAAADDTKTTTKKKKKKKTTEE